jgi:hypothetical protein
LGHGQRFVGFAQAARGLRELGEGLVKRSLQSIAFLVRLHGLLLGGLGLAFELHRALVG